MIRSFPVALAALAAALAAGCQPGPPLPTFALGPAETVPDPGFASGFAGFPDGHLTVLPDPQGTCQIYWAESDSYRSLGCDPMSTTLDPSTPLLSRGPAGSFDNGGAWLYSVERISDTRLIGFYHAEDHEFAGDPSSTFIAWKSAAWAVSDDNGVTWTKGDRFLTSDKSKPVDPEWGGNGDFSVIRHEGRYYVFFFGGGPGISAAVSDDPEGAPGTWKKYFRGEFSEPGLGGRHSVLPGLRWSKGGNPSVHWNHHLGEWVMVWHEWGGNLDIAVSDDLVHWSDTTLLAHEEGEKNWYPTIVGDTSATGGADVRLFYGHWADAGNVGEREMQMRTLRFE